MTLSEKAQAFAAEIEEYLCLMGGLVFMLIVGMILLAMRCIWPLTIIAAVYLIAVAS